MTRRARARPRWPACSSAGSAICSAFATTIRPLPRIDDDAWLWHVGLDAEATALLDDLYRGHAPEAERLHRLIGLFRLDFADPSEMRADLAGKPVYLGLAMTEQGTLRLKAQNLLVNLPLAAAGSAASTTAGRGDRRGAKPCRGSPPRPNEREPCACDGRRARSRSGPRR